jgi:hypothetical protein
MVTLPCGGTARPRIVHPAELHLKSSFPVQLRFPWEHDPLYDALRGVEKGRFELKITGIVCKIYSAWGHEAGPCSGDSLPQGPSALRQRRIWVPGIDWGSATRASSSAAMARG